MKISKLEAARRQLVTSIRLLFEDADSISVYTLAHASWEVLDALCKHEGKLRFRAEMSGANRMSEKAIKKIASHGRNFFKHADNDPEDVLEDFDDTLNDHVLIAATMDYSVLASSKPMEVQLYPLWYFAVYPEKLLLPAMNDIRDASDQLFPGLSSAPRDRQKAAGLSALVQSLRDKSLMSHPSTDRSSMRAIAPSERPH
ncbi:MAG: hypothetical protein KJ587_07245 [Alphaproteobacteria bacterium]|nr:hypothetical protein [Alphaproteobacteria bacterium]